MSQNDGETIQIDGADYTVYMLDPMVASDLLADLMAILAPAAASLGGLAALGKDVRSAFNELSGPAEGSNPLLDKVAPGIERAAAAFFQRFDKQKQREMISILSKVTHVGIGEKKVPLDGVFSVQFRGKMGALYRWLWFALKVQYKDFFSSAGGAIAAAVRNLAQG